MHIAYDAAKNERNLEVHGVSLGDAAKLEWDAMIAAQDTRREYGELRMVGYAPIGDRLFCLVFVDRGGTRRIISLRRANSREVKAYEQA